MGTQTINNNLNSGLSSLGTGGTAAAGALNTGQAGAGH
jgi:hypothetical protein